MNKQICDTEELRRAFFAAGITAVVINGEDQKQQDGSWLHICEYRLLTDDPTVAAQAAVVFAAQLARDWKSWRAATEQIRSLEQKSGTTRRDREFAMKVFAAGDFQFNSAKMVEDQIAALRPQLSLMTTKTGV